MLDARSLPRGIPAASLKRNHRAGHVVADVGLPRGIPAASLKHVLLRAQWAASFRLPRGIPAASLKRTASGTRANRGRRVFRGEYPRPH